MPSSKYLSKLVNTRVFVLGGTSGIGFGVAEAAVEHGALVTIASSNQANLDKTLARLQSSYPQYKDNINTCTCDISEPSRLEQNIEAALKYAAGDGKIDHIVLTAAPQGAGVGMLQLDSITTDGLHGFLDLRVAPILMLAKHARHYMSSSAASSFTMTSGTLADKPGPGTTIAGGLASALNGLAKGLAIELKPIRANTVSPGWIDTELVRGMPGGESMLEQGKKGTLTQSVGQPVDTAEAYLYLMKDRFVTGTVIRTDGGRVLV